MPRYWTIEAARAELPRVIDLLEKMRALLQEAAGQSRPAAAARDAGSTSRSVNGHSATRPHDPLEQAQRLLAELIELGVQVKDVEAGQIDFPFLHREEEVLLCFRLGEPDIGFWHSLDGGYAGRRPLSEL